MNKERRFGLTAAQLRLLALGLMLLDHVWALFMPGGYQWMTYLGRAAFPIFAFQIVEGYAHTSNFRRYALRLLLFGLVSEIPFNLMYASTPFYPIHQNVLFTLLLGLLAVRALDRARKAGGLRPWLLATVQALGCCLLAQLGMTDYGATGVLTVLAFSLFREGRWAKAGQLVALLLLHMVLFKGEYLSVSLAGHVLELQTQGFALLALLPIWLYNGRKGGGGRALQYGSYAFYPLHMLALYGLTRLLL